jgi:hypothetical protein
MHPQFYEATCALQSRFGKINLIDHECKDLSPLVRYDNVGINCCPIREFFFISNNPACFIVQRLLIRLDALNQTSSPLAIINSLK